jgi:hypothetical protein
VRFLSRRPRLPPDLPADRGVQLSPVVEMSERRPFTRRRAADACSPGGLHGAGGQGRHRQSRHHEQPPQRSGGTSLQHEARVGLVAESEGWCGSLCRLVLATRPEHSVS